jgi:two-component system nitrate/nitrite response regulator NarL
VPTFPVSEVIRILIVDDQTLWRDSLARLLAAEPDFTVAGQCPTAPDAIEFITRAPVDVVLLDSGTATCMEFLTRSNAVGFCGKALVLMARAGESEAARMLRLGAAGMLRKDCSVTALVQNIRDVHSGKGVFELGDLRSLVIGLTALPSHRPPQTFTDRERRVIRHVCDGLANWEIASQLRTTEGSVKAVLQKLFMKTGVRTRSQLVRAVLERYKDQM